MQGAKIFGFRQPCVRLREQMYLVQGENQFAQGARISLLEAFLICFKANGFASRDMGGKLILGQIDLSPRDLGAKMFAPQVPRLLNGP